MDRDTVTALIEKHSGMVEAVARRRFPTRSQDPDLLQCGMIGLWNAAERWDGARPFPPFAMTCIRNAMYNHLRTLKPAEGPIPDDLPSPGTEDERLDRLDLLARIDAAWPPNSRERLILVALASGVSKAALAASLGTDTYHIQKTALRAYDGLQKEGERH